jgi:hypothetical protein
MSARIDYHSTSTYPVEAVYAALVDPEFLRARLAQLGGASAEIVEHKADATSASFLLRHQLDTAGMPAMVRTLLAGGLTVERAEAWTKQADGSYRGTISVGVKGAPVPAAATGQQALTASGTGSELRIGADVTVSMPLFGGQIETFVSDQVRNLLDLESQFTTRWLAQHSA